MAKAIRSLRKAQQAARRGEPEVAIDAFRFLAAQGEIAACPCLAQLLAFSGAWDEVIPNAAQLIAHSNVVYYSNIFDDMIGLLGRAGHETGNWREIERAADQASEIVKRRDEREHVRNRQLALFDRLADYARGCGKAPHELIRLWGEPQPARSETEKMRLIEADVARTLEHHPRLPEEDPQAHAVNMFLIAKRYEVPELALAHYRAAASKPLAFHYTVYAAALLARTNREEEAWALLQTPQNLAWWWPCEQAEVAPVALLIDRDLQKIMTPERCDEVLLMPRGPERDQSRR